jgi:hypothetical protein
VPVEQSGTGLHRVLRQDRPEILTVFEGLRARLDQLLSEHTPPPDARARAASLQAALIEAKVAVGVMQDALTATSRELAAERKQLEDAERRGQLAAAVPDPETVEVANRFAAKHRERAAVLERKLAVQQDELALAQRELDEMAAQFRATRYGGAGSANSDGAWRDLQSAGGQRPETDPEDVLLKHRMDRAAHEAAADAQLAHLKKKLGKEP